MRWFKDLKVGSKLLLSFMLVLAISVAVGVFAIVSMNGIGDAYSEGMELAQTRMEHIFGAKDSLSKARMVMREFYYPNNTRNDLTALAAELENALSGVEDELEQLNLVASDAVKGIIKEVLPQIEQYRRDGEGIVRLLLSVGEISLDNQAYVEALHEGQSVTAAVGQAYADDMSEKINGISSAALKALDDLNDANDAKAQTAMYITIGILAGMALLVLVIAMYVPSLISKPLALLSAFMKKAAETGDISLSKKDVEVIQACAIIKDEIGQAISNSAAFVGYVSSIAENLKIVAGGDLTPEVTLLSDTDMMGASLRQMVDNLNEKFSEINTASHQVSAGSKQVADGAQALAQGSTEQAAAVEELSSSIGEVAHNTRENAEMAGRAAILGHTIKDNAEKGSRHMDDMMAAVKDINQASQSISKVIKVIDDIAFQTNILALNAAVEAARAGQHGKGFAVVAEEVRNLAAKSSEAAKETGNLIANSMEKAELGSRIADETAASLTEIVGGINESSRLITEIAQTSDEQSSAIEQINKGIDQVAQVVQQNSATAEESAAASEEMSGQSNLLEELIAQFKLKDNGYIRHEPVRALHGNVRRRIELPDKYSI
ncbi:MAG: methyl-accepting chemotaxis protein [Oscillospiraceae bacterium]|nr:methyl-accepting chemotaxis protein [Oscillospiraceae bacterium]